MNFNLTEEHIMIRDAARDFARTELLPGVIERDEKQEFPNELVKKMGDLGFMGIMVDPKYGGSGMDTISYILVMEQWIWDLLRTAMPRISYLRYKI